MRKKLLITYTKFVILFGKWKSLNLVNLYIILCCIKFVSALEIQYLLFILTVKISWCLHFGYYKYSFFIQPSIQAVALKPDQVSVKVIELRSDLVSLSPEGDSLSSEEPSGINSIKKLKKFESVPDFYNQDSSNTDSKHVSWQINDKRFESTNINRDFDSDNQQRSQYKSQDRKISISLHQEQVALTSKLKERLPSLTSDEISVSGLLETRVIIPSSLEEAMKISYEKNTTFYLAYKTLPNEINYDPYDLR